MEVWKDIPSYEGLYQVSNLGNVKRLSGFNGRYSEKEHLMTGWISKNGYRLFALTKHCITKCFLGHRLVAQAFIKNPQKMRCINHKNEDKTDNRVENLEWCSHYENNHYGTAETKNYKPVMGTPKNGVGKLMFDSIKSAAKYVHTTPSNIGSCCKGKRKTAGGYKWEYASTK